MMKKHLIFLIMYRIVCKQLKIMLLENLMEFGKLVDKLESMMMIIEKKSIENCYYENVKNKLVKNSYFY